MAELLKEEKSHRDVRNQQATPPTQNRSVGEDRAGGHGSLTITLGCCSPGREPSAHVRGYVCWNQAFTNGPTQSSTRAATLKPTSDGLFED